MAKLKNAKTFHHSGVFANVAVIVAHKFPTITEFKRKKKKFTFKVVDAL